MNIGKHVGVQQNVCIRVIDEPTGKIVSEHRGHNAATNLLFTGIGHFLIGEGLLNQGSMLSSWIPQYISLGTMGLFSQDEDENGLPAGIGEMEGPEEARFIQYMKQCPGYGSDGYDDTLMNNRKYAGLGPVFENRPTSATANCELITANTARTKISFRDVVPEYQAEWPKTVDVVFSTMISTGALAKFREPGKDYIFITEAGLWSNPIHNDSGENGLLAGYRILPTDSSNWDMTVPYNRKLLKENIIKVGINQVVQVVWKIQLGAMEQLGAMYGEDDQNFNWDVRL